MKFLALALTALFVAVPTKFASAKASTGKASFYWQGHTTANGERYNKHGITAAHRTLPFGTLVRVTRLSNGRKVTVRINDRGPFIRGRIIDLSVGAAQKIGLTRKTGVTRVRMEVIGRAKSRKRRAKRSRRKR